MAVIENQQTSLLVFLSVNSTEITNHNRRHSMNQDMSTNDIETAGGRIKRFYKNNKRSMDLSFSYLPNNTDKTVDGRAGRDFLYNLALNGPYVSVSYQDRPSGPTYTFNGFINDYSERLIRRDLQTQCSYYDVNLRIEEQ